MTNETIPSVRHIDIAAAPPLEEIITLVGTGVSVIFTRDAKEVARLEPLAPADAGALLVAEAPAIYKASEAAPALTRLIGGGAARSVLGAFVMSPDRPIHQREVARRAGVGLRSAQLALERLESLGLIASERDGNRRAYRAVRSDRFEQLRALLQPEFGAVGAIAAALAPFAHDIRWASIYGSVARGTDTVASDIDVLVVGEARRTELAAALAEAEERIGREINVAYYKPAGYAERMKADNHFLNTVLNGPHIDLIGGPDDA